LYLNWTYNVASKLKIGKPDESKPLLAIIVEKLMSGGIQAAAPVEPKVEKPKEMPKELPKEKPKSRPRIDDLPEIPPFNKNKKKENNGDSSAAVQERLPPKKTIERVNNNKNLSRGI